MKSPVELWDRANTLADNNKNSEGRLLSEDLWLSLVLIFGQLRAIEETMSQLSKDESSLARSSTISLLDTSMEEMDEKLQILEALAEQAKAPV